MRYPSVDFRRQADVVRLLVSNAHAWPKPLLAMIEASHSRQAMEQFRDYEPEDGAFTILRDIVQGMLHVVPPAGSSCVIMSALLSAALEEPLATLVPVVAGALNSTVPICTGVIVDSTAGGSSLVRKATIGTATAGSYLVDTSSTSRSAALLARGIVAPRWHSESFPSSGRMPG